MFTLQQREEFDRSGIVSVPGAIASREAAKMCDRVWDTLGRRFKIRRDDSDTWKARRVAGFHDLPKAENFAEIGSPAVCEALDNLLGDRNWQRPERWGSLLVTFPESTERWDIPHKSWHLDFPAPSRVQGLFAVRIFVCLAKLRPAGGGTLFLAGSHRLVQDLADKEPAEKLRSAEAREGLIRDYPWVKGLCSFDETVDRVRQFVKGGAVIGDVNVRVIEMTGEAGDVFMTHPLMLHAGSRNCARDPRLVLSSTVYRSGVSVDALYQ
jgi:ectoine hydroxylase-related dioxygenase (phytanoyl-CoA dioxygenase family)